MTFRAKVIANATLLTWKLVWFTQCNKEKFTVILIVRNENVNVDRNRNKGFIPWLWKVESQKVFIYFFISFLSRRVMWYTFDLGEKNGSNVIRWIGMGMNPFIWTAVKRFKHKIIRTPSEWVVTCIERKKKSDLKIHLSLVESHVIHQVFCCYFLLFVTLRYLLNCSIIKRYREI